MDEQGIIYKCSWFETKRHRISHTDMYFKELKDTLWVFDSCDYNRGLATVLVIKVSKNSNEYDSAVSNSALHDETGKLKNRKDCEFCKEQYPNQIGKADSTCGQCGTPICGACDCDCEFSKELRDKERKI